MQQEYQVPPIHPELMDSVRELHAMLCAANHSLKTLEGVCEISIDEAKGYTFCDLTGDIYTIRRAIQMMDSIVRGYGLKGDPIQ